MPQKEAELDEELETTAGDDDVIAEDANLEEVFANVELEESEDGAGVEDPAEEGALETEGDPEGQDAGEGTATGNQAADPKPGESGQPRGKDGKFVKADPAAVAAAAAAQPNTTVDPNAPAPQPGSPEADRTPFAFRYNKAEVPFEGAYRTKDGDVVFPAAAAPHLQNLLSDGMQFRGTKAERDQAARNQRSEIERVTREHADVVGAANEVLTELEALPRDANGRVDVNALAEFANDFITAIPELREKHRAEAATKELEAIRAQEKERTEAAEREQYETETREALEQHILELAESPEYKDLLTDEDWVEIFTFAHQHSDRVFSRVEEARLEGEVELQPGDVAFNTDYVAELIESRAKILRRVKEQATTEATNAKKVIEAEAKERAVPKGKKPPPVVAKRETEPVAPRAKVDVSKMTREEYEAWMRKPLEEQLRDLGEEE